jgi:hypothetical protein
MSSLEKLASQNDARVYKLLLSILDVKTDYKTILKDMVN